MHAQAQHRVAGKFNRLVLAAVHAEAADHVQHHVLGADPGGQAALPDHLDGLRHAQPDLACDHHAQHLGAADAKHVGAKSATGRRMRVAADAKHAGPDMPALRHHHVADALAVIHMGQGLLACPVAGDFDNAA